jgi:hypothetical protein
VISYKHNQNKQGEKQMSTRAYVGKLNLDGSVRCIYTHWDGYPSCNGKILLNSYKDEAKVDKLLDLGNISILGPEIGEKHDFGAKDQEGVCTAYGRDRGETGQESREYPDVDAFLKAAKNNIGPEFVYLFNPSNGEWSYTHVSGSKFEKMTDEIVSGDYDFLWQWAKTKK